MENLRNITETSHQQIDDFLRTLVTSNGVYDRKEIAAKINIELKPITLTAQLRKYRGDSLDCCDSKEPWTDQEELEMLVAHKRYQNRWSDVAQALGRRSNNSIKNRFYSIFRKIKNKIKRSDFSYESKLELLKAFYFLELMENYLACSQPIKERNDKRGKDFIYSLLRGLSREEVIRYKTELKKFYIKISSFEELLLDLEKPRFSTSSAENNIKQKSLIEIFSYITKQPVYDESCCVLPLPRAFDSIRTLTTEEKSFLRTQVFPNKEPNSPGIFLSSSSTINSAAQSSAFLSVGISQKIITKNQFEGFSEFTEKKQGSTFTISKP